MRFKKISQLEVGDRVGSDLLDINGRMFISKNSVLTENLIKRLSEQGFNGLYVNDAISWDIEVKQIVNPEIRNKAMNLVQDENIDGAIDVAREMVENIIENGIESIDFNSLKIYDDYTFIHSVNVAILASVLGMLMRLSHDEIDDLMIAGLLHDLGKYQIPVDILNKQGRLTENEYMLLKTHSQRSYDLIENRMDISDGVKKAVLLHHENIDGSGYPLGIMGESIPMLAKILHVADTYDALIADRAYKKGYTPGEASEYLMGGCGIMFDPAIIDVFIKRYPIYQKGSEVVLSNGEHALIIENTGDHIARPVVRMVTDGSTIDLTDRHYSNLTMYTGDAWLKKQQLERERQRYFMLGLEKRKRILVVDDMRANRAIIKSILENDYDLSMVGEGSKAVETIANDKAYDLIIMDIDMPGMNGLDATREINKLTEEKIPVLFVSSIRDINTVIACKELKAAGYISRPYQPGYIKTEVERIINRSW